MTLLFLERTITCDSACVREVFGRRKPHLALGAPSLLSPYISDLKLQTSVLF